MATLIMAPTFSSFTAKTNNIKYRNTMPVRAMRIEKPLEDLYHVRVERNVLQNRKYAK